MSQRPASSPPQVIRRRARSTQIIALPTTPERPEIPTTRGHAQTFALALLALVFAGTLLLASPWTTESGESTPAVDAFFTSVSAASVTGLVTLDTQQHWNLFGEIVILVLIQAGGLGFMVGASLVLQALRRGQTTLTDAILIRNGAETLSLREAGHLTSRIIVFTAAVEAAGAIMLTLRFRQEMPFFEALWHGVFHSVSAFCNAGFDLQGSFASVIDYQDSILVNTVFILLIQAGALSFVVFSDVANQRSWKRLGLDTKLVLLANLVLVLTGTTVVLAAEWNGGLQPLPDQYKPMAALFQSVSARTAGFGTISFSELQAVTLFVWIGLMMIGGASGSTAGGVKLSTVSVIFAAVMATLRGQSEPHVFGRRITSQLVFRALSVVTLFVTMHFAFTIALAISEDVLTAKEDVSFLALMFETMSAMATVGLTTGITPSLTSLGKVILALAMIFGRLGPLSAAYALQRRQRADPFRLPEATVRIG